MSKSVFTTLVILVLHRAHMVQFGKSVRVEFRQGPVDGNNDDPLFCTYKQSKRYYGSFALLFVFKGSFYALQIFAERSKEHEKYGGDPDQPHKLHIVTRVKSVMRRPYWEKEMVKHLGLEKVRLLFSSETHNKLVWLFCSALKFNENNLSMEKEKLRQDV